MWNGAGGACPDNPGFYNVAEKEVRPVHVSDAALVVRYNGSRQWLVLEAIKRRVEATEQPPPEIAVYGKWHLRRWLWNVDGPSCNGV
jgi:hypothetical protein